MIPAAATLILGFVIGYLGQRSRLCFISGYRDFFLTRNTLLLKGIFGTILGAVGGYILFSLLGGSVPGFPLLFNTPMMSSKATWLIAIIGGLGVGFVGVLAGGCPFRMHVLAAEGRKTYWFYLLGFYAGLIFFNLVTSQYLDMFKSMK